MMDEGAGKLMGCFAAMRKLAEELQARDDDDDISTAHVNGWIDMIADALKEDHDHLKVDDDPVECGTVRMYVNVAVAYLEGRVPGLAQRSGKV
jgi:hypothetical protein